MKEMLLHGKKGEGKFALVDDEDYARAAQYKWYLSHGYAVTTVHLSGSHTKNNIVQTSMSLHRFILRLEKGDGNVTDHKNRDRLDCQKGNMVAAGYERNARNVGPKGSMPKGVHMDGDRFVVGIAVKRKSLHLAQTGTSREAALIYDKAARHFWGDEAYLNYPEEYYTHPVRHVDFEPDPIEPVSNYLGVSYFGHGGKRVKRWRAIYRKKTIGYFMTEIEAAGAYADLKGVNIESCICKTRKAT